MNKAITIITLILLTSQLSCAEQPTLDETLRYFKEQFGIFQPQNFNITEMTISLQVALEQYLNIPLSNEECTSNIKQIIETSQLLLQNLYSKNVYAIATNVYSLYSSVQVAIEECQHEETGPVQEEVAELELEQQRPIFTIIGYNPIKCLQEIKKIEALAVEIENDLKNFNLTKLAADVKEMEALLAEAKVDCNKTDIEYKSDIKGYKRFIENVQYNPIKCLQEIKKIEALAVEIENDLKNFNLTKLAADVKEMEALLAEAKVDCNKTETNFLEQPQQSVNLPSELTSINSDIKRLNIKKALKSLKNFSTQFLQENKNWGKECIQLAESIKNSITGMSENAKKLQFGAFTKEYAMAEFNIAKFQEKCY